MYFNIDLFNGDGEEKHEYVQICIEGLSSLKRLNLRANTKEIFFSIRK